MDIYNGYYWDIMFSKVESYRSSRGSGSSGPTPMKIENIRARKRSEKSGEDYRLTSKFLNVTKNIKMNITKNIKVVLSKMFKVTPWR